MKKESEKGKLDPKLRNQLIVLVLILAVALIAAIAGSAAVAVQQSRVPWAAEERAEKREAKEQKKDQKNALVSSITTGEDDIDSASDSVDADNAYMAQTQYRPASTTAYSYRYRTYQYQYATTAQQ